jgi:hypothetical protein
MPITILPEHVLYGIGYLIAQRVVTTPSAGNHVPLG